MDISCPYCGHKLRHYTGGTYCSNSKCGAHQMIPKANPVGGEEAFREGFRFGYDCQWKPMTCDQAWTQKEIDDAKDRAKIIDAEIGWSTPEKGIPVPPSPQGEGQWTLRHLPLNGCWIEGPRGEEICYGPYEQRQAMEEIVNLHNAALQARPGQARPGQGVSDGSQ